MARNITPKSKNYAQWYQDVIKAGHLADNAPVRGCMVIRPTGYAIWEAIQSKLDAAFKTTGHENAYFPLLIPMNYFTREAEHVEGFAPELAVVTHGGGEELEEPYAVRPTSETIIGQMYSKWIQSWRDLPVLLNQWCNVMRWEKRPRLFLRTSEFLWQEGHTAHETEAEARAETLRMLEIYRNTLEQELAIPILSGEKTAGERFPGAIDTYTCEAMMTDGKALQSATSHYLGQNFARAFNIQYQSRTGELTYCYTTSWGMSTRTIGALIMVHSDDDGLVLPPNIAPIKAVILPISKDESKAVEEILPQAEELSIRLNAELGGHYTKVDKNFHDRPSDRFFTHLQQGVPLRLELGEKDISSGTVRVVRRDTGKRYDISREAIIPEVKTLLEQMQQDMYTKAAAYRKANTHIATSYDELKAILKETGGFVQAYFGGSPADEVKIREETGATPRCILSSTERGECIITGAANGRPTIFAKAY